MKMPAWIINDMLNLTIRSYITGDEMGFVIYQGFLRSNEIRGKRNYIAFRTPPKGFILFHTHTKHEEPSFIDYAFCKRHGFKYLIIGFSTGFEIQLNMYDVDKRALVLTIVTSPDTVFKEDIEFDESKLTLVIRK